MAIVYDLNVPVLPDDTRIWAVFPGENREFVRDFIDQSVIFLDLPGVRLPARFMNDDDGLRRRLALSQRIAAHHLDPENNPRPSRDIALVEPVTGRSAANHIANVRLMFHEMKAGDLVIFAEKNVYLPIHIGRVVEAFNARDTISIPLYGRERLPVRRVNWLPTETQRRDLPEELSALLSNRRAVIQIDKVTWGDFVFASAFENYVSGEKSRYVFHGESYRKNALDTVPPINLISYFEAAFNSIEEDALEDFASKQVTAAIRDYFDQEILDAFQVEFSSPGTLTLAAKRATLALVTAVLVTAAISDHSYADTVAAQIVNTAAPQTAAAAAQTDDVEERYRAIMIQIGEDRFNEIKRIGRDSVDGVGLATKVKEEVVQAPAVQQH